MDYKQEKARRINFLPPLPVKQKIIKYSNGNMTQFILDAVNAKIREVESRQAAANRVSNLL